MNSVPIDAIRGLVEKTFPYSVNINTADLVGALQRLMLFETNIKTDADDISSFVFDSEKLTINKKENSEVVFYDNTYLPEGTAVTIYLSLDKLRRVLENSSEQYFVLNFGPDEKAIMLAKGNVRSVIQVAKPRGI